MHDGPVASWHEIHDLADCGNIFVARHDQGARRDLRWVPGLVQERQRRLDAQQLPLLKCAPLA